MNVFVDTNVILDSMLRRSDFYEDSHAVFNFAENKKVRAFVSAVSMTDIFYILRKFKRDVGEIYSLLDDLSALFSVVSITQNSVNEALTLRWKDFEDAVQYVAAKEAETDYIITRNRIDFETSAIPCISPAEFVALINAEER